MKTPDKNLLAIRHWETDEIIATIWDTSKYKTIPKHYSGNMSKYNLSENFKTVLKERIMGSKKKVTVSKSAASLQNKVVFTRDSASHTGGTVTLGRLESAGFYIGDLGRGDLVGLDLFDGKRYFQATGYINRMYGSSGTLYVNDWPKGLSRPSVGRSRKIDIVDISKI